MFYLDSYTAVSLQCVALVFWKAYVDRMLSGWDPNKILPDAY